MKTRPQVTPRDLWKNPGLVLLADSEAEKAEPPKPQDRRTPKFIQGVSLGVTADESRSLGL